ncbi:MAG: hypothetical protein KDD42_06430 [Bdellovibrionales bacterium]|nr:hypothetical protein [Bdellovibrionales bacterium]
MFTVSGIVLASNHINSHKAPVSPACLTFSLLFAHISLSNLKEGIYFWLSTDYPQLPLVYSSHPEVEMRFGAISSFMAAEQGSLGTCVDQVLVCSFATLKHFLPK